MAKILIELVTGEDDLAISRIPSTLFGIKLAPVQTQESTPVKAQESTPVKAQESTPVKAQELTSVEAQESTPVDGDEPEDLTPVQTQESTPVKTEESNDYMEAERARRRERRKSRKAKPGSSPSSEESEDGEESDGETHPTTSVPETTTVSRQTLRDLLASKVEVGENRKLIKAELSKLGAQNISSLEDAKLQNMYDFLKKL